MNYSLEDIYGSGIMNPNKVPSTDINDQIQQYMDSQGIKPGDAILTPDVVSTDTPVATSQPSTSTPNTSVPPVANAPEEVKVGSGSSVAASEKAIDFNNLDKLEKKSGIIDKRVAGRMAPLDKEYNYQAGEQARISGDQAQIARGVTEVDKQKADLVAAHDIDQSRLLDEHNNAVAAEEERGRQRTQSAIDTHQRMLQDYMTTQVDPGMMWKNMTGGEKAGSGLAVFASAFLGAKGIDTPVMTMLDKALDRNIDAQLQNINIKGRALDEQGKMVQMVREQSASDLEAKLRLKDMALESGKYAIAAQMSQFGSKLAELKGQEVISNIEQNQLKFRQDLVKERTQQEQNITGQEITKRGQELDAAARARSAKLEEDKFAYAKQKDEDAKKAAQLDETGLIWDTSRGGTGVWRAYKDIGETQTNKIRAANSFRTESINLLQEAREIKKRLDGGLYSGPNANALRNADEVRMVQLSNTAKANIARARSGLTVNEHEIKQLEESVPFDTWTTNNNFEEAASGMQQILKSEIESDLNTFAKKVPDDEAKFLRANGLGPSINQDSIGKGADTGGYAPTFGLSANAGVNQYKPEATRVEEYVSKIKTSLNRDAKSDWDAGSVRSNDWLELAASFNDREILDNASFGKDGSLVSEPPTKAFVETGNLYDLVKANDTGAAEAFQALQNLSKETKNTLGASVNKYTNTLSDKDLYTEPAIYAQYYLKKLGAETAGSTFEKEYLNNPDAWYGDIK